jgi:hypothetical protein
MLSGYGGPAGRILTGTSPGAAEQEGRLNGFILFCRGIAGATALRAAPARAADASSAPRWPPCRLPILMFVALIKRVGPNTSAMAGGIP